MPLLLQGWNRSLRKSTDFFLLTSSATTVSFLYKQESLVELNDSVLRNPLVALRPLTRVLLRPGLGCELLFPAMPTRDAFARTAAAIVAREEVDAATAAAIALFLWAPFRRSRAISLHPPAATVAATLVHSSTARSSSHECHSCARSSLRDHHCIAAIIAIVTLIVLGEDGREWSGIVERVIEVVSDNNDRR